MLNIDEHFLQLKVTKCWLNEESYNREKLRQTKVKTDKIFYG